MSTFKYRDNTHTKTFTAPSTVDHYTVGTEVYNTGAQAEWSYYL
ncbi:MAG TPA: hypothetical protein PKC06_18110 [Saprospiraceae bacterium]|nr:hypothetical protein [Saprospiraceae bacterium]